MAKRSAYRETISALHVLNIIAGAIFNLVFQIGIFFCIGWLLVKYCQAPEWVYAPLVVIGALSGIISMMKLIVSASKTLERIEAERDREKESQPLRKSEKEGNEYGNDE